MLPKNNVNAFGIEIDSSFQGPILQPMTRYSDDWVEFKKINDMSDFYKLEYSEYPFFFDIKRDSSIIWCAPQLRKICENYIGYFKASFIGQDYLCRYFFKTKEDLQKFRCNIQGDFEYLNKS